MKSPTTLTIKNWSVEDRPREKLLTRGRTALTDAELLAILISSGNQEQSAVELSRQILHHYGNNLNKLGKVDVRDLLQFKGIGEAKAVTISAALELGRRRKSDNNTEVRSIRSSRMAYEYVQSKFQDLPHEEFWILCLNRANKPIAAELIGRGGVSGTVADVKLIFKKSLEYLSSGIIAFHNHPSGNCKPSSNDRQLTKRLKEAGKLMDMPLLDHIIVTDYGYFSFADRGEL